MIDKNDFKFNIVLSHGTKYLHLIEIIKEAELRFVLASLKDETFHVSGKGQSKIFSKRWKCN